MHCFTVVYGHELLMYACISIIILSQAVQEQYKDGYHVQNPIVISPNNLSIHVECILEDGSRSRALLKSGSNTVQCLCMIIRYRVYVLYKIIVEAIHMPCWCMQCMVLPDCRQ